SGLPIICAVGFSFPTSLAAVAACPGPWLCPFRRPRRLHRPSTGLLMVFTVASRTSLQKKTEHATSPPPSFDDAYNNSGTASSDNNATAVADEERPATSIVCASWSAAGLKPRKHGGAMDHLLQVARRTGKSPIGFKIQLVIHRMSAHLSNYNGAELVAMMTRGKKKVVTKCAAYQSAQKEVVWGDILPFSCTLYMAKTGLFQAKLFTVQVFDTRNDQHIASFEFNLAELVQSNKESCKESLMVPTSKCQDPRASLSLTIFSSRVTLAAPNGQLPRADPETSGFGDDVSFDGSRSDLSACTLESRISHRSGASNHHHRPVTSPVSKAAPRPEDTKKVDVTRNGSATTDEGHSAAHEQLQASKLKVAELLRTVQQLEEQLREADLANGHLERKLEHKDAEIEKLQKENEELRVGMEKLENYKPRTKSEADGVMHVDFIKYMTLQEECDALKVELETTRARLVEAETSKKEIKAGAEEDGDDDGASSSSESSEEEEEKEEDNEGNDHQESTDKPAEGVEEQPVAVEPVEVPVAKEAVDEDTREDKKSEASSADEFMDAHDPGLVAEIQELKQSLAALKAAKSQEEQSVAALSVENGQLIEQIKQLQARLEQVQLRERAQSELDAQQASQDKEQQEEKVRAVCEKNERLVEQLNELDSALTRLKDEREQLTDKVEELEVSKDKARAEVDVAQETIEELRRQVTEISEELQATQQELETVKNVELAQTAAAAAAAAARNQELQEKWEELRSQNNELQSRVTELEQKLTAAEENEQEREAELQQQVAELKQETATLREELAQLKESKEQAENELHERAIELKQALDNHHRLSVDHTERVSSLETEKEALREQVDAEAKEKEEVEKKLRAEVESLQKENDYYQHELVDSKMKLAELTEKNDELASQYKKMEKNFIELKIKAAERDLKDSKKKPSSSPKELTLALQSKMATNGLDPGVHVSAVDATASADGTQRAHMEALLAEMVAMEAWGERDKDASERQLQALHACVLDPEKQLAMQELPKRMCAYEFKPGDIAWNCKVCQVDETCVMCNDCFISSDHDNHEVFFYYTQSGGCCDCGDTEAWAPEGFCTRHKGAQDADPLSFLPSDVLINSRACLDAVLKVVLDTITEARYASVIEASDVTAARERLAAEGNPDAKYTVLVHFNELQTSQEFASSLQKAHPAVAYQMLKIVGDTSTHKQSVVRTKASAEEALELVEALQKNGVISSIVSHSYKSRTALVSSLLQWLVSLANLSDGLCRLVCEQVIQRNATLHGCWDSDARPLCFFLFVQINSEASAPDTQECYPTLEAVILADSFLPKHESDALHSLLMALLADPLFKRSFAIGFTHTYRQLYREFVAGVGSSSVTILAFGVQFFNRASFVRLLVDNYDLLEVLTTSALETLRKRPRADPVIETTADFSKIVPFLHPSQKSLLSVWDLFALAVLRSQRFDFDELNLPVLEQEAVAAGLTVSPDTQSRLSKYLTMPPGTEMPGRHELSVGSPVFVFRRYVSGLLDLRYSLQIDGISEYYVLARGGQNFAELLRFMSYVQGMCAERRQFGSHVEMESRGWVVAVEFVSTVSDVFGWIASNVFKGAHSAPASGANTERLQLLVRAIAQHLFDCYFMWLATVSKYFPPEGFEADDRLRGDQTDAAVSCHFPLHRAVAQLLRTLCDVPEGLQVFYDLVCSPTAGDIWLHDADSAIGSWHQLMLVEPVLQAIVWDAQVHSGLWVRNGNSAINHSMNYGEPPFCLRFRDLDLLLLQFVFKLKGIDWTMESVLDRFGVEDWYDIANTDFKDPERMAVECMTLLCQLASELPPKVKRGDAMQSLLPFLRREIVQRLCVGPCAHSDLSKIATDFFSAHENLFPPNFSSAPVLDQVLKELCVQPSANGGGDGSGGKFQYRLKPELYAEYSSTFIHLTRKQHEFAHENWFQERIRVSRMKEQQQEEDAGLDATQSTWLDFPIVNIILPCAPGFRKSRISILHPSVCRLVYEALWRASTDPHSSLSILSRAVHLFTLQLYVVEEVRYMQTLPAESDLDDDSRQEAVEMMEAFMESMTSDQPSLYSVAEPRPSALQILLKLNPWSSSAGHSNMVSLDGDQKHEIGRGIDWLVHRLARLSENCRLVIQQHQMTRRVSKEEEDRKMMLAARKKAAQLRAIQAMQQRQAAFAEQMKRMMAETDADEDMDEAAPGRTRLDSQVPSQSGCGEVDGSSDIVMEDAESLPECAMCHSVESEDSFICFVGFTQSSAVFSRLNSGTSGRFMSTPMDEMHVGEDVPVHLRMCGHAVHHNCWESYHATQFQRAITGGHHRHSPNAVDVTKKEFLCPLCKAISNVLIPAVTDSIERVFAPVAALPEVDPSIQAVDNAAMMSWLAKVDLPVAAPALEEEKQPVSMSLEREKQPVSMSLEEEKQPVSMSLEEEKQPVSMSLSDDSDQPNLPRAARDWLDEGLASLCMAIHKVACGAMQKSRPERYTTSACHSLFHTLLCSFVANDKDQQKAELHFLQAMQFLPQMVSYVKMLRPVAKPPLPMPDQIQHLLYYGGSDVRDGVVILEEEHPSTQTQTRKQSQWGKVRWPAKPLLLCHLGTVLVKGVLLARSRAEALFVARLASLGRLVQAILWYCIARNADFADNMANDLEYSQESVDFLMRVFMDDAMDVANAEDRMNFFGSQIMSACGDVFPVAIGTINDKRAFLNFVACDVVPFMKVATCLVQWRTAAGFSRVHIKPTEVTVADAQAITFVSMSDLLGINSQYLQMVARWVHRFKSAYDEMQDSGAVLQQWLTSVNLSQPDTNKLTFPRVLMRDLHTSHTALFATCSGGYRTRYLRSLPRPYVKFYSELAKRRCESCNQFPARPAVCLLCGLLLCAANTCPSVQNDKGYPEESNPGACTVHAKKCGRGSGIFLLVLEGAVLLVYWKLAAYVSSLYVDEYGEEFGERNRELNKGRPLYLNEERRERLLRLWLRHEIPGEVVKIQNSSERVIRNSHY
ncbi:TPA: LOW QUALITY PROTEIN: hypothetical protein N0F65_008006, partial [Lagenidium giganteum]